MDAISWLAVLVILQVCAAGVLREDKSNIFKADQEVIEGDIVLDNQLRRVVDYAIAEKSEKHLRKRRNAVVYEQMQWKDGIVPYVIHDSVGHTTRRLISLSFYEFHRSTCLWFTPRRNETDYILIVRGEGCYSKIGRQGGEQVVSIGDGCNHKDTVMHELMHAIGFFHETSRYDRDRFVKILWWNIQYGAEKNFITYNHGRTDTFRLPYDKHSLMHYENKAFTKNFGDTIQAKEDPDESLGGKTFSKIDLKQINLLYKCNKPRYAVRQDRCQDRREIGCLIFLSYPRLCNMHAYYTMKFCRRTCRVCEVGES